MALGISIGIGVSTIAAAAGAGGGLAKRGASTLNRLAPMIYSSGSDDATENTYIIPFVLGSCGWKDLQVSWFNWIFGQWGVEFSGGTDFVVPEFAIDIGGQWHKVTWGGQDSLTLTNGSTDVLSDPLYPSDFGLAGDEFPVGLEGNFRILIRGGSSVKWPASFSTQFTYQRLRFAQGAVTFTNPIYGTGDPQDGASGPYSQAPSIAPPLLVGGPATTGKFIGGLADSIGEGTGDNTGSNGRGFTRVAYSNYATKANPLACINFGWSGGTLLNWIGDGTGNANNSSANATNIALPEAYLKYCNIVFEQYGTNGTAAAGGGLYPHQDKLWTVIKRGSPGCKLVRTSLFARASSTDSWATVENQTPTQAPGGDTDLFEQYCISKVGAGLVDYYLNYNACRASTDRATANYYKWAVNGTANYATDDSLHPSTAIHDLMYRGEARALIDTITP